MVDASSLRLCYASAQSLGDSGDDYIEMSFSLLSQKVPVGYAPMRSIAGTAQNVSVQRGEANDTMFWSDEVCDSAPCTSAACASANASAQVYTMTSDPTVVTLPTGFTPGSYALCYRVAGADSLWTLVTHTGTLGQPQTLYMVQPPTFTPVTAIAAMATPIAFSGASGGSAIDTGDFVVMRTGDCDGAPSASTGATALGRTALNSGLTVPHLADTFTLAVVTDGAMNAGGAVVDLVVCFATAESGGDSVDDYFQLASNITLVPAPTFEPLRTAFGNLLGDHNQVHVLPLLALALALAQRYP